MTFYVGNAFEGAAALYARLGKHKTGSSCLYVNRLADIDLEVLERIVRHGLDDLRTRHEVDAG